VVIGDIIASTLNRKLDIIVSRKIGAPDNPELAIGAVMPDGSYFLNQYIVNILNVPQSYIVELVNITQANDSKSSILIYYCIMKIMNY
jgi:putative phosphoribosyl transferase